MGRESGRLIQSRASSHVLITVQSLWLWPWRRRQNVHSHSLFTSPVNFYRRIYIPILFSPTPVHVFLLPFLPLTYLRLLESFILLTIQSTRLFGGCLDVFNLKDELCPGMQILRLYALHLLICMQQLEKLGNDFATMRSRAFGSRILQGREHMQQCTRYDCFPSTQLFIY